MTPYRAIWYEQTWWITRSENGMPFACGDTLEEAFKNAVKALEPIQLNTLRAI